MISKNTISKEGDSYMAVSFRDLMHPPEEDNRTGDEIARDVVNQICGGGANV